MKSNITVSDVIELSIPERIQFVEDVWDSIRNVNAKTTSSITNHHSLLCIVFRISFF